MATRLKIRGCYSSALTRFLLDSGYTVVDPSVEIRERFGLAFDSEEHNILIRDREDLQGIYLIGETEILCPIVNLLQGQLVDAVLMQVAPFEDSEGLVQVQMELPGASKAILDDLRSAVIPTLARHHRLRIVHPKGLDRAEQQLLEHPERKSALGREVFNEAILLPLRKNGVARLDHARISGKRIRAREGVILESDEDRILIKRTFSTGRYDGLDLPIDEGDYGLTEAREGTWFVKHSYYSRDGELKGEYYNVNTPVELYPYGVRYVDLEVDVVRRAGKAPRLVDREKLAILAREGFVGAALERKAMEVVEDLMHRLQA